MKMSPKEIVIEDAELGTLTVRPHPRARRFIYRVRHGALEVTVPPRYSMNELHRSLQLLRPRLLRMLSREKARGDARLIGPQWRIETPEFSFRCEEARVARMCFQQRRGQLVCYYPTGQDFTPDAVQQWLVRGIENSLRLHARVLLLPRLGQLASARGLSFARAAIHRTQSRWGSCSAKRNINLSLYLMLLPRRLQDYVMHHELTHLIEMNHGPRFHALLDQALNGQRVALEQEMRHYRLDLFSLARHEE